MPGESGIMSGGSAGSRRRNIKHISNGNEVRHSQKAPEESQEKIVTGPMDLPFFIIIMVLLVMGIIMMFSAGYAWAIAEGYDGTYYVKRQFANAAVGLVLMLIASLVDYHWYLKPIFVFGVFCVSIILLILCRVGPFTDPHNYAYRWIKIGPLPSFQPSEIMKFAIILLFSYLISINYSRMK